MLKVALIIFIATTAIALSLNISSIKVRPSNPPHRPPSVEISPSSPATEDCKTAGCSSQLCVGRSSPDLNTTCEWKKEYSCLKKTRCELQPDNTCGWTKTPEYISCLQGQ